MKSQRLRVKKLFFTGGALKRKMTFMLLHMIVHSILVFLGYLADCTNKLAGGILLIFHRHVAIGSGRARVQFFHRLRVPPPRRLIPITVEPTPGFLRPCGILLKKAATHWFSGCTFLLLTELLLSRALADLVLRVRVREEGIYLLPSFCAVATMPSFAIILLFEPFLRPTTKGVVPVPCIWLALSCCRISVEAAVFLSAGPAPRLSAALAHVEFILVIKAAGKDIVTCGVLECPATAPGTAFCICRTGLWHSAYVATLLRNTISASDIFIIFCSTDCNTFRAQIFAKSLRPLMIVCVIKYFFIEGKSSRTPE